MDIVGSNPIIFMKIYKKKNIEFNILRKYINKNKLLWKTNLTYIKKVNTNRSSNSFKEKYYEKKKKLKWK